MVRKEKALTDWARIVVTLFLFEVCKLCYKVELSYCDKFLRPVWVEASLGPLATPILLE